MTANLFAPPRISPLRLAETGNAFPQIEELAIGLRGRDDIGSGKSQTSVHCRRNAARKPIHPVKITVRSDLTVALHTDRLAQVSTQNGVNASALTSVLP
ncbi:hypothetical protein QCN27_19450 [Cereibacter sp. SYSU M97828]|nr:hypothetical protein [Cereibacter flavus]